MPKFLYKTSAVWYNIFYEHNVAYCRYIKKNGENKNEKI